MEMVWQCPGMRSLCPGLCGGQDKALWERQAVLAGAHDPAWCGEAGENLSEGCVERWGVRLWLPWAFLWHVGFYNVAYTSVRWCGGAEEAWGRQRLGRGREGCCAQTQRSGAPGFYPAGNMHRWHQMQAPDCTGPWGAEKSEDSGPPTDLSLPPHQHREGMFVGLPDTGMSCWREARGSGNPKDWESTQETKPCKRWNRKKPL